MQGNLKKIVVSCGEPAGIGPDIVVKALQHPFNAQVIAIGDPDLLEQRARNIGIEISVEKYSFNDEIVDHQRRNNAMVIPVDLAHPVIAGELNVDNSDYVVRCVDRAANLCMNGEADAMVTAPIHKGIINQSGVTFSGHTEFIAELTDSSQPVMMLANGNLRVCLATTHLPLKDVSRHITKERLISVIKVMTTDISKLYGIGSPVIGVCGLNPHAGESGHLGSEEIEVIEPTLNELRDQGLNLVGPLPADTAFTQDKLKQFDGILAMYHDQGLPVIKHSGFGEVVNVTLGLPIIRTSVDHGTALDIAGTGDANESSLIVAIELAIEFAAAKRRK